MEISPSERHSENDAIDPAQSPISNLQSPFAIRYSLFAILLLALFLRFYCLTCSSYWHDEGNTWALVQRSFAQIAAAAAADIHPPGYYWLLKLWSLAFGYSPWTLRAFSALTGTLTVAVVYAIANSVLHKVAEPGTLRVGRTSERWLSSRVFEAYRNQANGLTRRFFPPAWFRYGGKQPPPTQPALVLRRTPATTNAYGVDLALVRSIPYSALPLLAALFAAVNPFQIFYSQEARMYSLLALESAALVWVGLQMASRRPQTADRGRRAHSPFTIHHSLFTIHHSLFTIHHSLFTISFSLLAAAGLWTHYIFPVVLAAIALAWLWQRLPFAIHYSPFPIRYSPIPNPQSPIPFLVANLLALLLFLPWLPTAIDRVLHWPAGGVDVSALDGLRLTLQTLAVGPIRSGPELAWPWLFLVGLLPLIGLWRMRGNPAAPFLALWLLAPIGLMFGLGLFSDSFLKFLLVASPAWCILTAYCVLRIAYSVASEQNDAHRDAETQRKSPVSRFMRYVANATTYAIRNTQYALLLAVLLLAIAVLPAYYADPAARDNYAGMAETVAALGDPATGLVILNAPGQADVWGIYDPGLPVLVLPAQRPPDRAASEAQLAAAVAERRQIFALFWATEQSDPDGIVEGWLNRHAFKGLESWQGNVRFVQYSLPNPLACEEFTPTVQFGDSIQLHRVCLPSQRTLAAGTSLPIALHWRTNAPITQRYKATVQLLNQQNQVIGQQDGEPGGGSLPTDGWQPGVEIVDNRGVYAPPGAPPVEYRLILALYDAETGQRLPVADGDALLLATVSIARPLRPLPAEMVPMRARLNQPIGPVVLAGFDAYAKGFAHDPARPLTSGELLHLTLYWQAPSLIPADWPADLAFTLALGDERITAPLSNTDFPTDAWQAGDFVRGDVDVLYRGDQTLVLSIDGREIRLARVVNGQVR